MKILRLIIPTVLILVICIISYNTYNNAKSISNNPLSVIPNHSALILKVNKPDKVASYFENKKIWKKLTKIFKSENLNFNLNLLEKTFKKIKLDKNNSLFITLLKDGVSENGILISSELNNNDYLKFQDFFKISQAKKFEYDNSEIYLIKNDSLNFFATNVNNILCVSSSKRVIEDAIKSSNSNYNFTTNKDFINIYNTVNSSNEINLIYNFNNLLDLSGNLISNYKNLIIDMNQWVAADLKLRDDKIIMNGFNLIDYSLANYSDILNNQEAEQINAFKLIPDNVNFLFSLGFDDAKKLLSNNIKLLENKNEIWESEKYKKEMQSTFNFDYNEFTNQIDNEAGLFICGSKSNEEKRFSYFKTKESIHASSLIQRLIDSDKSKIYLDKEINYIRDKKLTSNLFGTRFNKENDNYYTVIDDYFIFSNSTDNLEFIIDNYISGNTLTKNNNFVKFSNNTLSKSNIYIYFNTNHLLNTISNNLNNELNLDSLQNFTGLSYQITNNKSYQINNLSLFYDKDFKKSIKEKWFFQLDTLSNMKPQVVYNHALKENVVIIQDESNKLYCITKNKQFNWTRNLNSSIIGKISQGDFFKNNKVQMIFNTADQIYMLDRYGRDVEKFPLNIKNSTNLGHSLFDYNKSKRYRIMIVENDNSITNYDRKGKKVLGWKFQKNNKILKELKHFKNRDKDYIVKISKKDIELLAINGSSRLGFKSQGEILSKNEIIIDNNNNLLFVNSLNKLLICNLDGNSSEISIESLDSSSSISYHKESNQLIFSNKNELFFLDNNFIKTNSIVFNEEIKKISTYKDYIIVKTKNEIILLKNYAIVKGTPLKFDGTCTVTNLSDNKKINILLVRNKVLYNYELE